MPKIKIEDHVLMFHANCGGIVTGVLGEPLICAECGREMTAFVAASEEASVRPAPEPKPEAVK